MTTVVQSIDEWNRIAAQLPREQVLGLVPTMGALHGGHAALFEQARRRCSVVVTSIFINSLQFDQKSDYCLYPRTLEGDAVFCAARGVNYIFAPSASEMYPQPQRTFVEVEEISAHLCGSYRPGHFRGVATVVLKLFQILRPRLAFFGEKDYEQLSVVQCIVRDLNVPVEVIAVPTVRETDGLAMSSRNRRLDSRERTLAPYLHSALQVARQLIASGERESAAIIKSAARVLRAVPEISVEYFELIDPETIHPMDFVTGPVRAALAVWIGKTRLIDNLLCVPPAPTR
jgi:pantoate--beta-alanine ligase